MVARRPFEPIHEVEAESPVEVAAALVGARGLIARVPAGVVTLDALIALAASRRLHTVGLEEALEDLPTIKGRAGVTRVLSLYVARGCKYALTPRGALTPRSVYAVAALHLAEVAVHASPPAVAAPNTTLGGALARMAERGSICAFIVRAGKLKGVLDAWTALGEVVRKGEEGLEASCSGLASDGALARTPDELAELLASYGFAAVLSDRALMIDDVSLHRALVSSAASWLGRVR